MEALGWISSEDISVLPMAGDTTVDVFQAPPSKRHSIVGGPSTVMLTEAADVPTDWTFTVVETGLPGAVCIIFGEMLILKLAWSLMYVKSAIALLSSGYVPTTTSIGYMPGVRPEGTWNTAENAPLPSVLIAGRVPLAIWSFWTLGGPKNRLVTGVFTGNPLPLMVIHVPTEPTVGFR